MLFRVPMCQPNASNLEEAIQMKYRKIFVANREDMKKAAMEQIPKGQNKNRQKFNERKKPERVYEKGDLIGMKRTQLANVGKLTRKYLAHVE